MRSCLAIVCAVVAGCATYAPPPREAPVALPAPERVTVIVLPGAGLTPDDARGLEAAIGRSRRLDPDVVLDLEARLRPIALGIERAREGGTRAALASELLREAERRLNKLDVPAARGALDEAAALVGPAPGEPGAFDAWVGIETARALADLADGKPADAAEKLREVARLRPGHALDEGRVPPEALEAYRTAREEAGRVPRVRLLVETEPPAAAVYVDGQPRGAGPVDVEVAAGRHFVSAAHPGLRATPLAVEAAAGPRTVARVRLQPAGRGEAAADARLELARGPAGSASPARLEPATLTAVGMALGVERMVIVPSPGELVLFDGRTGGLKALGPVTDSKGAAGGESGARTLAGVIERASASPPPPATWLGTPPDEGPGRAWYRKWWGWAILGGGGALLARAVLGRTLGTP